MTALDLTTTRACQQAIHELGGVLSELRTRAGALAERASETAATIAHPQDLEATMATYLQLIERVLGLVSPISTFTLRYLDAGLTEFGEGLTKYRDAVKQLLADLPALDADKAKLDALYGGVTETLQPLEAALDALVAQCNGWSKPYTPSADNPWGVGQIDMMVGQLQSAAKASATQSGAIDAELAQIASALNGICQRIGTSASDATTPLGALHAAAAKLDAAIGDVNTFFADYERVLGFAAERAEQFLLRAEGGERQVDLPKTQLPIAANPAPRVAVRNGSGYQLLGPDGYTLDDTTGSLRLTQPLTSGDLLTVSYVWLTNKAKQNDRTSIQALSALVDANAKKADSLFAVVAKVDAIATPLAGLFNLFISQIWPKDKPLPKTFDPKDVLPPESGEALSGTWMSNRVDLMRLLHEAIYVTKFEVDGQHKTLQQVIADDALWLIDQFVPAPDLETDVRAARGDIAKIQSTTKKDALPEQVKATRAAAKSVASLVAEVSAAGTPATCTVTFTQGMETTIPSIPAGTYVGSSASPTAPRFVVAKPIPFSGQMQVSADVAAIMPGAYGNDVDPSNITCLVAVPVKTSAAKSAGITKTWDDTPISEIDTPMVRISGADYEQMTGATIAVSGAGSLDKGTPASLDQIQSMIEKVVSAWKNTEAARSFHAAESTSR